MVGYTQFKDSNGAVEASEQINSDGSGYLLTQKGTQTVHFLANAVAGPVSVDTAGDVSTTVKAANGTADSFSLSGNAVLPVMTVGVNGHGFADVDNIKDIYQDATGGVDIMSNVAGFGQSDFRINTDGTSSYKVGQDTLAFAANTLSSLAGGLLYATVNELTDVNDGTVFGLGAVATGYSDDINWNPTSGKAELNITNNTTGAIFSSSLGYINPGDTLKVLSNSLIALYDANGHELNSTLINADGSQTDTNYNADGSVASVYTYDANGNPTNGTPGGGSSNAAPTPGLGVKKYYSTGNQEEAFGEVATDKSGYLYAETPGETLRFAAGASVGLVEVDGFGELVTTVTSSSGIQDSFILSGAQSSGRLLGITFNGHEMVDSDTVEDVIQAANGNVTVTAATQGFGLSTLTLATDGSASYAIGQDTIQLAANTLELAAANSAAASVLAAAGAATAGSAAQIADSNDGEAFRITSAAAADYEDISFNANTGQAILSLTNIAGGSVFTSKLGQINPGDVLKVSSSLIALYDANGHELDSTQVNADGSQIDTNYNADGSIASTYSYNAAGQLTSTTSVTNGVTNLFDTNGKLEAVEQINSDGSGYILQEGATQTLRFAAGAAVSAVSVDTAGDVNATVVAGGVTDKVTMSDGKTVFNVNGHSFSTIEEVKDINVGTTGQIIVDAIDLNGFPESVTTLALDGTETYQLAQDTLTFAPGVIGGSGAPYHPSGTIFFGMNPAATGFAQDITWNPATGQAALNLTNTSTGKTFSTGLGQINGGDTLKALSNSLIALYDGSGHELSSTQINSDGSQTDTTYNANGTVANSVSYDGNGNTLMALHAQTLAAAVATMAPAGSATMALVSQPTTTPIILAAATH